jgi:ATP-dependent DNA ligase
MVTRRTLPAGFIVPAQPVERDKAPTGPGWVHEIKHDGYRLLVRREGASVQLFTRKANTWTERCPTIAAAAARLKAESFTIDGEAVVIGPDGLSRFDKLRRRDSAKSAMLFAFDLIEHNGEDLRALPFHLAEEGALVFEHVCRPRRRGHRVEADRRALSIRPVLDLDQGP